MRCLSLLFAALALTACAHARADSERYGGRDIILTVPANLPPAGERAMVIALHGGGGNAHFMQSHLNMDVVAQKYGFIVAYLNGTDAGRLLPGGMHAWNAGAGCCGLPADREVDDVGYITDATRYLAEKYGVAPGQIFVTGHSNGSMMAQLMLCQTNIFASGVAISGPINPTVTQCPAAKGKRILAIHGALDENVPVIGGKGTKGPMRVREDVVFRAENSAQALFEQSGATYDIQIIPDTDHTLEHLDEALIKSEHQSVAEKAARYFSLAR